MAEVGPGIGHNFFFRGALRHTGGVHMSKNKLVGALSAFVVAGVPVAVAAGSAPPHPSAPPPSKPTHPGKSHKCKPHAVAYRVSGTLVGSSLTLNGSGGHQTASG